MMEGHPAAVVDEHEAFSERVAAVLAALEPGEVVSYGEVAAAAGSPGGARAVGRALRDLVGVPWWRVVRGDGRLAAPDPDEQARRLATEGVVVRGLRAVTAAPHPPRGRPDLPGRR